MLVPMLIMIFEPSRNKSVVTVTIAVLLFVSAIAFGVKASNVETMVSAATYAAVLVVFIGTNNGTSVS